MDFSETHFLSVIYIHNSVRHVNLTVNRIGWSPSVKLCGEMQLRYLISCIPLASKTLKKDKKIFEDQTQSPKPKISKCYNFFPWFGSFGVNDFKILICHCLKGVFSKSSGKMIVAPFFVFGVRDLRSHRPSFDQFFWFLTQIGPAQWLNWS